VLPCAGLPQVVEDEAFKLDYKLRFTIGMATHETAAFSVGHGAFHHISIASRPPGGFSAVPLEPFLLELRDLFDNLVSNVNPQP